MLRSARTDFSTTPLMLPSVLPAQLGAAIAVTEHSATSVETPTSSRLIVPPKPRNVFSSVLLR